MLSFKKFMSESIISKKSLAGDETETSNPTDHLGLPPEPGTAPIPKGHVRLFHQTSSSENLDKISKEGIRFDKAKGIEGPKGIWSAEPTKDKEGRAKGFYDRADSKPTAEFHIPEEEWEKIKRHPLTPHVIQRDINSKEIVAIHHPWHKHVRYMAKHGMLDRVKNGEFDDLIDHEEYGPAIKHIKHHL